MSEAPFRVERRAKGVVWLTLDRPEIHNAFDDRLIAELTKELEDLGADAGVRVVVLTGAGRSFSAGADLNWMRRTATYGEADNLADARALARLMQTLNELPKPTVARVNGAALGGGTGLVACCDIVVASAAGDLRHDRGAPRPDPLGDRAVRARRDRATPCPAADADGRADQRGRGGADRAGARGGSARAARCRGRAHPGRPPEERAGRDRGGQAPDPRSRRAPDRCAADRRHRAADRRRCGPRPKPGKGIGAFLDKRAPAWLS